MKESESDSELKEISRYIDKSSNDVAESSSSDDGKGSEGSEKNYTDSNNDLLSMLSCSRYIFEKWYNLQIIMDEVGSFPRKISVRSRMAAY